MNILITGASGFIGKNLVEYFSKRFYVFAPSHQELDLLEYSSVCNFLEKNSIDVVIHSANINNTKRVGVSDYQILDGNIRMFLNLVQCNHLFEKMFYFGSGAQYDREHYIPDMKEEYFGEYVPHDSYGFSKYIMSVICMKYNNIYELRLFGVFGKYEEYHRRFISNAICRALAGKSITIQRNVFFDYLYIVDLCRIMDWFVQNELRYKQYNICRGMKIDLFSLALIIRSTLQLDCDIEIAEDGLKPEYTGNNDRLIREMGNFQFTDFEQSIDELCEWYKKNWSEIDVKCI